MAECRFRPLGDVWYWLWRHLLIERPWFSIRVFGWHLPSILYRFDVISAFLYAENGANTISAARGRGRSKVTVRFLDPDLVKVGFGIFRLSFTCQKLFEFFDVHVNCALKFMGKGYSPVKNLSSMKPQKNPSFGRFASFETSFVQIGSVVWSVGPVTINR
jgi:hypothetical protein